jgi:hypothetical protein
VHTPPVALALGNQRLPVLGKGVDQFVEIAAENEEMFDFQDGTGVSISAWFTVDSFTKNWQALVAKGEGNRWRVHRRGGENVFTANGGNADVSQGTTDVCGGGVHHIALVRHLHYLRWL